MASTEESSRTLLRLSASGKTPWKNATKGAVTPSIRLKKPALGLAASSFRMVRVAISAWMRPQTSYTIWHVRSLGETGAGLEAGG